MTQRKRKKDFVSGEVIFKVISCPNSVARMATKLNRLVTYKARSFGQTDNLTTIYLEYGKSNNPFQMTQTKEL